MGPEIAAKFTGKISGYKPGFEIHVGGKKVGTLIDLTWQPVRDAPRGICDVRASEDDNGFTHVTFQVESCKKCERPRDGWRRLLFWRKWHTQNCAIGNLWRDIEGGKFTGMSMGGSAINKEMLDAAQE